MSISNFISKQSSERQNLLTKIHEIIIHEDKSVEAKIGSMMGKEMILYNEAGMFKYGLSSVKNHMSLHIFPMYSSKTLYSKYEELLSKAAFQKGCINFKNEEEMPADIVGQLIADSAKIDLRLLMESYAKSKSKK